MKEVYKKWWFWLIILAIVIIMGLTIFFVVALNFATKGIHEVAFKVQSIDNESTVYSSAGENTVIIEIPNYSSDKNDKIDSIRNVIKEYSKQGNVLGNYSKCLIILEASNNYVVSKYTYKLPEMEMDTTNSTVYIDSIAQNEFNNRTQNNENNSKGEDISLTAGKYVVGTDIKVGKYDAIAEKNSGNFFVTGSNFVNEILSAKNDNFGIPKYSNIYLKAGDEVEIKGNLVVKLQAK